MVPTQVEKMRAKLTSLNNCAVPLPTCAGTTMRAKLTSLNGCAVPLPTCAGTTV